MKAKIMNKKTVASEKIEKVQDIFIQLKSRASITKPVFDPKDFSEDYNHKASAFSLFFWYYLEEDCDFANQEFIQNKKIRDIEVHAYFCVGMKGNPLEINKTSKKYTAIGIILYDAISKTKFVKTFYI